MIIQKKKHVLKELAVTLHLLMEFDPDTTSLSVVKRVRDRAKDALEAARHYTGDIGGREVDAFLKARPLSFTVPCGKDIVKGDTIRFVETVFNNKKNPPTRLGSRRVIADVTGVHNPQSEDPVIYMTVISSGGTWELKPDTPIRRNLRSITRSEAMRVVRSHETHKGIDQDQSVPVSVSYSAPKRPLTHYSILKRRRK